MSADPDDRAGFHSLELTAGFDGTAAATGQAGNGVVAAASVD